MTPSAAEFSVICIGAVTADGVPDGDWPVAAGNRCGQGDIIYSYATLKWS